MSSGLSMASVNKIKDLASRHEYSVAVDILDSQQLEKSLNPQFLRVCGEVYENVGRMREARGLYVRAHKLAPEANRIILSLINFYLKRGFFGLAEKYKEQFVQTSASERGQMNGEYIFSKAEGADLKDLYNMLYPYYLDNMDEKYTFELYLVAKLAGETETEKIAYADYVATFKRGEFTDTIKNIKEGREKAEDYFYIYSKERNIDDDPSEESIRVLENEQLEKDYLKLHPSVEDAVIIDEEEEKKKKKKRKTKPSDDDDEISFETAELDDEADRDEPEKKDMEKKLRSFIKDKFKKKKTSDAAVSEETAVDTENTATADVKNDDSGEAKNIDSPLNDKVNVAEDSSLGNEKNVEGKTDKGLDSIFGSDAGINKQEMREIMPELTPDDILSFDFDNGFAPESESISEMKEKETDSYANPFDIINAYKIDEEERKRSEEALSRKTAEDLRIELEISNVDENSSPEKIAESSDFSDPSDIAKQTQKELDESRDEMDIKNAADRISGEAEKVKYPKGLDVELARASKEEEIEAEFDRVLSGENFGHVEHESYESTEPAVEENYETAGESYVTVDPVAEERYVSVEPAVEEETYEAAGENYESVEPAVEEETYETAGENYESVEQAFEEEIYETAGENYESEEQAVEEETYEAAGENYESVEPAVEEETYEAATKKYEPKVDEPDTRESESDIKDDLSYDDYYGKNIKFPEFKTDLFNISKREEVENRFDDIAEEEKEKLSETLEEEERLQREAEELLKSLGIKL